MSSTRYYPSFLGPDTISMHSPSCWDSGHFSHVTLVCITIEEQCIIRVRVDNLAYGISDYACKLACGYRF